MGGDPNHLLTRMILQVVRLWYVKRGRNILLLRGLKKKRVDEWLIGLLKSCWLSIFYPKNPDFEDPKTPLLVIPSIGGSNRGFLGYGKSPNWTKTQRSTHNGDHEQNKILGEWRDPGHCGSKHLHAKKKIRTSSALAPGV